MRQDRWLRVAVGFGFVLGIGLVLNTSTVRAQAKYVSDFWCGACHKQQYQEYKQHGHPWMEVHTGGQTPASDLFAPIGLPLPTLPKGKTWADIQDVVANFKDTTTGSFLGMDGNLYEGNGAVVKPMPGRCNTCHNTAGTPTGTGGNPNHPNPNIQGTWQLDGIQCEQCHGPGATMKNPADDPPYLNALCRDCHSSGDSKYRIPANVVMDTTKNPPVPAAVPTFGNHHPQGDEYRRSPHKDQTCAICHDPHKSTWHDQGGVLYSEAGGVGMMCTQCHSQRVQGAMGLVGIECTQCHMPDISGGGDRAVHLFRINNTPMAAVSNLVIQKNDSGKPTVYWGNGDGTTDPTGQSFLTLDLVCTKCHQDLGTGQPQMTLQQMSNYAPFVHRANGMTYLEVNESTSEQVLHKNQPVEVEVSIYAGSHKGEKANCFVLCYGPKGWSSWNGKRWVAGQVAFKTHMPLTNMPETTVMRSLMPPGKYTFYLRVHTAAQDYNSFVKVQVLR
jgi:hypothetical protein